jgi:hypothetical protein
MKKEITLENKVDGLVTNLGSLSQTVEKLAGMIEEKFEGVGEQLVAFEDRVNDRFGSLEKSVSDRFHVMGDELRGQQNKMARVEKVLKIG